MAATAWGAATRITSTDWLAMSAAATEPENTNGHHQTTDEPAQEVVPDLLSDKRNWL